MGKPTSLMNGMNCSTINTSFLLRLGLIFGTKKGCLVKESSLFSIIQLQRLAPRGLSQSVKKVKEQPSCRLVLCYAGLIKALALLFLSNPFLYQDLGDLIKGTPITINVRSILTHNRLHYARQDELPSH